MNLKLFTFTILTFFLIHFVSAERGIVQVKNKKDFNRLLKLIKENPDIPKARKTFLIFKILKYSSSLIAGGYAGYFASRWYLTRIGKRLQVLRNMKGNLEVQNLELPIQTTKLDKARNDIAELIQGIKSVKNDLNIKTAHAMELF